jgi:hypothetical protein
MGRVGRFNLINLVEDIVFLNKRCQLTKTGIGSQMRLMPRDM